MADTPTVIDPILEQYKRAFVEAHANAADPDDLPGVIILVHIDEREVTHKDGVDGRLLDAEVRRLQAEATGQGAAFIITWHEGRDNEFAQAALLDEGGFLVEIHDDATPPGHCLSLRDATADDVIAILRGWLGRGTAGGRAWKVEDWREGE